MERVDTIIVGAGVVGLAVAERLSREGREIVVAERHDGFGRETSSRNSEVIHGGLYYPEDSLKAQLCVEGNRMLYAFCERASIPHARVGKLVVGGGDDEVAKVHALHEQGSRNGVEGLRMLTGREVRAMEPHVECREALSCPSSGILDTHTLMKRLEQEAEGRGVTVAYNCEVVGIDRAGEDYAVEVRDVDGSSMVLRTPVVVNAAGLGSDRVAALAGIDIDAAGYRLSPCKGEYFAVRNRHRGKLRRLVYPAPTPISLGVHAVLGLDGALRLGPNAFYVEELDYDVDPEHVGEFLEGARQFLPFIEPGDLSADMAGIRPKLQREGESFRDFVIAEESSRGLPGMVSLVGIESPGLTASLAIAERVARLVG